MDPKLAARLESQRSKITTGESATEVWDGQCTPNRVNSLDSKSDLAKQLEKRQSGKLNTGESPTKGESSDSPPARAPLASKATAELAKHLDRQSGKLVTGESAVAGVGSKAVVSQRVQSDLAMKLEARRNRIDNAQAAHVQTDIKEEELPKSRTSSAFSDQCSAELANKLEERQSTVSAEDMEDEKAVDATESEVVEDICANIALPSEEASSDASGVVLESEPLAASCTSEATAAEAEAALPEEVRSSEALAADGRAKAARGSAGPASPPCQPANTLITTEKPQTSSFKVWIPAFFALGALGAALYIGVVQN